MFCSDTRESTFLFSALPNCHQLNPAYLSHSSHSLVALLLGAELLHSRPQSLSIHVVAVVAHQLGEAVANDGLHLLDLHVGNLQNEAVVVLDGAVAELDDGDDLLLEHRFDEGLGGGVEESVADDNGAVDGSQVQIQLVVVVFDQAN